MQLLPKKNKSVLPQLQYKKKKSYLHTVPEAICLLNSAPSPLGILPSPLLTDMPSM